MSHRAKIVLASQAVSHGRHGCLPLATGYLKAMALADDRIRTEADVLLMNYGGDHTVSEIAHDTLDGEPPDVLACSVLGWNYRQFGEIAETYKSVKPDGLVVFGGNHVTHNAQRVFRMFPAVDVVVNGEGEHTFVELVRWFLGGRSSSLDDIGGVSFVRPDGAIATTRPRERIRDLDEIPSPFLTGAIDLVDAHGRFLYEVGLMETNRGCPYQCAYCYWGGAVGQKIRTFSRERLREEVRLLARSGAEYLALCDANFGMLRRDLEFVEDLIQVHSETGLPRNILPSWAKNKGRVFYEIASRLKRAGVASDFVLALQSLSDDALRASRRSNMPLNRYRDLVAWLQRENYTCYAELIWGLPGETRESFLHGYDEITEQVDRVAAYTHLVLPNTEFYAERGRHGIVTCRTCAEDDFERVLKHSTMTVDDNRAMHRFLFWARLLQEHAYLRLVWKPLRYLVGMPPSRVILSIDRWMRQSRDGAAQRVTRMVDEAELALDTTRIVPALELLYIDAGVDACFEAWWRDEVVERAPTHLAAFLEDLLRRERLERPMHDARAAALGLPTIVLDNGIEYYLQDRCALDHDVPAALREVDAKHGLDRVPRRRCVVTSYHRTGFARVIWNHEFIADYVARCVPAGAGADGAAGSTSQVSERTSSKARQRVAP